MASGSAVGSLSETRKEKSHDRVLVPLSKTWNQTAQLVRPLGFFSMAGGHRRTE